MCGLFGADLTQIKLGRAKRAILVSLLASGNDQRGGQTWGHWSSKLGIRKGFGDSTEDAVELSRLRLYFAHTRFATHGNISLKNAHPFSVGRIIGAHNGVLSNHEELNTRYNRKFEVDSQHLFAHLNGNIPFNDIKGYGSISWIEKGREDRIYLCKMRKGSLSTAHVIDKEGHPAAVWSSDKDHLTVALDAIGADYTMYKIETGKVYFTQGGELYHTKKTLELSEPEYFQDWKNGKSGRSDYTVVDKRSGSTRHGGHLRGWDHYGEEDEDEWELLSAEEKRFYGLPLDDDEEEELRWQEEIEKEENEFDQEFVQKVQDELEKREEEGLKNYQKECESCVGCSSLNKKMIYKYTNAKNESFTAYKCTCLMNDEVVNSFYKDSDPNPEKPEWCPKNQSCTSLVRRADLHNWENLYEYHRW